MLEGLFGESGVGPVYHEQRHSRPMSSKFLTEYIGEKIVKIDQYLAISEDMDKVR